MSTITQCPKCKTQFKATQEQLEAHQGMVRCGQCQAEFNAVQHVYLNQPSPQLILPILQDVVEEQAENKDTVTPIKIDLTPINIPPLKIGKPHPWLNSGMSSGMNSGANAGAQFKQGKGASYLWASFSAILFLTLIAQAGYFFRVEIAARLPGAKPALVAYCELLQCEISLPGEAEKMSIESSNLEAHPKRANIVTLDVILRNSATYAQAYPDLELTLTDTQEQVLARRSFSPADYLKLDEARAQGLAANREASIKLFLDTMDIKPTGYKLFLYYPS